MKHRYTYILGGIRRVVISAIIGLIVSVGVAWLITAMTELQSANETQFMTAKLNLSWWCAQPDPLTCSLAVMRSTAYDCDKDSWSGLIRKGPWWSRVSRPPTMEDVQTKCFQIEKAWGWPTLCLVAVTEAKVGSTTWSVVYGIPKKMTGSQRVFPLKPIWRGLFINDLMFGSGAWLLLLFCSSLRVFFRKRHGKCVQCGYQIRELRCCPECGLLRQ